MNSMGSFYVSDFSANMIKKIKNAVYQRNSAKKNVIIKQEVKLLNYSSAELNANNEIDMKKKKRSKNSWNFLIEGQHENHENVILDDID